MKTVTVKTATLPSGLTLPYAETGGPGGTPVVFIHAYVESWRYFEVVVRQLPASLHGYAPTQRGHGDADRPPDGYRPEDFAADIVGFMDAVGIRRAVLVGSSSGGLVSQFVASSHPDRVSALVLISSPATLADKPGVTAMWEEISALEDPLDRGFVEEFVRSTSPEGVPDEFLDVLVGESLKVPARVWKETMRGLIEADVPVTLGRITAPTLLISRTTTPSSAVIRRCSSVAFPAPALSSTRGSVMPSTWRNRTASSETSSTSSPRRCRPRAHEPWRYPAGLPGPTAGHEPERATVDHGPPRPGPLA